MHCVLSACVGTLLVLINFPCRRTIRGKVEGGGVGLAVAMRLLGWPCCGRISNVRFSGTCSIAEFSDHPLSPAAPAFPSPFCNISFPPAAGAIEWILAGNVC